MERERQITELNLESSDVGKVREYMKSDGVGRQLEESKECLSNWAESEHMGTTWWWDPVLTGVMVVVILGVIILTARWNSKKIRENGRKSLEREMTEIMDKMDDRRSFRDPHTHMEYLYVNYILPTVAFNSMITSGDFAHFSPGTQTALRRVFLLLQAHNRLIGDLALVYQKMMGYGLAFNGEQIVIKILKELHITDSLISSRIAKVER